MKFEIESASPATSSGRIDDLEVLRALAVLMTCLSHQRYLLAWKDIHKPVSLIDYLSFGPGVDIFFVISGFVIARSLTKELIGTPDRTTALRRSVAFWIRRAYRLTPTAWLWAILATSAALWLNAAHSYEMPEHTIEQLVAAITNTANFQAAISISHGIAEGPLAAYWSLSLEEQFYLLLPFFFIFAGSIRRVLQISLALVAIQFLILWRDWPQLIWFVRSDGLLLGVVMALTEKDSWRSVFEPRFLGRSGIARATLLIVSVFALGVYDNGNVATMIKADMVTIIAFALVWSASFNRSYLMKDGILKEIFIWIGARSYSIYIIHMFVYRAIPEVWLWLYPGTHLDARFTWPFVGVAVVATCIFADLNYRCLETPLRDKGRIIADAYLGKTQRVTRIRAASETFRGQAVQRYSSYGPVVLGAEPHAADQ
jgi:peptidoglycan/LPS O-acetylase OafA/YrhL